MVRFRRKPYEPVSIQGALAPYHYPLDEKGRPRPTPSPRWRYKVRSRDERSH